MGKNEKLIFVLYAPKAVTEEKNSEEFYEILETTID